MKLAVVQEHAQKIFVTYLRLQPWDYWASPWWGTPADTTGNPAS